MHEIMNYYTHSLISDKIYTKFWYCQFEKKKFPKMLSSTEFQFGPIVYSNLQAIPYLPSYLDIFQTGR